MLWVPRPYKAGLLFISQRRGPRSRVRAPRRERSRTLSRPHFQFSWGRCVEALQLGAVSSRNLWSRRPGGEASSKVSAGWGSLWGSEGGPDQASPFSGGLRASPSAPWMAALLPSPSRGILPVMHNSPLFIRTLVTLDQGLPYPVGPILN